MKALSDQAGGGEGGGADLGDWMDVAGGGGEENFVGVTLAEDVGREVCFFDCKPELLSELDDEGASDASQAATGEGWRLQAALGDEKEVAASAFA